MNIDLERSITDIDHETILGAAKKLIVDALYKTPPKSQDGGDAYKQYRLAERIDKIEGEVSLTVEELSSIKDVVGRTYIPLIVGQIYKLIEGAEDK